MLSEQSQDQSLVLDELARVGVRIITQSEDLQSIHHTSRMRASRSAYDPIITIPLVASLANPLPPYDPFIGFPFSRSAVVQGSGL